MKFKMNILYKFYFSHQPVNESSQLSEGISKPIVEKLEKIMKIEIDDEKFDHLIRKLALFSEYMILGTLMYLAFNKTIYLEVIKCYGAYYFVHSMLLVMRYIKHLYRVGDLKFWMY